MNGLPPGPPPSATFQRSWGRLAMRAKAPDGGARNVSRSGDRAGETESCAANPTVRVPLGKLAVQH
eukprot:765503-Hanusia_phi.AAC.4